MDDIPGKSLTKYVLDLLKLAKDKGYPHYEYLYELYFLPFWRRDSHAYCAIVCAAIQDWLRRTHKYEIWIQPTPTILVEVTYYMCHLRFYGIEKDITISDLKESYELQLISGLEYALTTIRTPNGTTTPG